MLVQSSSVQLRRSVRVFRHRECTERTLYGGEVTFLDVVKLERFGVTF